MITAAVLEVAVPDPPAKEIVAVLTVEVFGAVIITKKQQSVVFQ